MEHHSMYGTILRCLVCWDEMWPSSAASVIATRRHDNSVQLVCACCPCCNADREDMPQGWLGRFGRVGLENLRALREGDRHLQ